MTKPTEEEVRLRAHQLWEQAGRPDGRGDEFWHEAEKELGATGHASERGGDGVDGLGGVVNDLPPPILPE